MKLKILLIGSFTGREDEGFSHLSNRFQLYFSKYYDIKCLNTYDAIKPYSIQSIFQFKPDIIHYLTGPTIRSLIILKIIKLLSINKAKTVVSATRPYLSTKSLKLIKFFKPDMILTQASKWDDIFSDSGIPTSFVPNPIDINKFRVLSTSKDILRKKYDLPLNKKLLLHVGHIKKNRDIELLVKKFKSVSREEYQLIVVGSIFFEKDSSLENYLISNGFIVINKFLENIEEIYNACDYYIFHIPKLSREYFPKKYQEIGVIDMPLSILEALACGLPVISSPIDSIENLIKDIKTPPVEFLSDDHAYIRSSTEILDGRKKDFTIITDRINEIEVFNQVEKIYKKLTNQK